MLAMLIRREAGDEAAIRAVTWAAFARPGVPATPVEVTLVDELRASRAWLPVLSLVATDSRGEVVGHVACTRGMVDLAPVLALGPLSVRPDRQRCGFGQALMHAVLGAADALGEPLVALLGSPDYYSRFGFRPGRGLGVSPPRPQWRSHFQVRTLTTWDPSLRATFAYPEPFDRA